MKSDRLIIVFAKNPVRGTVKTRLAKSVGDDVAFAVYKRLLSITEKETAKVKDCDLHIWFTNGPDAGFWKEKQQFTQEGNDLGKRMQNAFLKGFALGYKKIIGIGTDLPELNAEILDEALNKLESFDAVFGPAKDGGYYLLGMNRMINQIFEGKPWSTETLLKETIGELTELNFTTTLLEPLNDVDTLEDLKASSIAGDFSAMID